LIWLKGDSHRYIPSSTSILPLARLNIEHFRRQLAEETDETKRQTLLRLLAEEEKKLTALMDPPSDRKERR